MLHFQSASSGEKFTWSELRPDYWDLNGLNSCRIQLGSWRPQNFVLNIESLSIHSQERKLILMEYQRNEILMELSLSEGLKRPK